MEWTGNLNDDCKPSQNGLHLHAEQLEKNRCWWQAISNVNSELLTSSDNNDFLFTTGEKARTKAELIARKLCDNSALSEQIFVGFGHTAAGHLG